MACFSLRTGPGRVRVSGSGPVRAGLWTGFCRQSFRRAVLNVLCLVDASMESYLCWGDLMDVGLGSTQIFRKTLKSINFDPNAPEIKWANTKTLKIKHDFEAPGLSYYVYTYVYIYIYQFWVAKPQAGATVAAVATRRPKRWAELIALARKSAGTLLLPVSPQSGEVKNDEDGDGCWDGWRRMVTWWRNMQDIFQRPLNGWWNWPIQSDDLALIKTIWSKDLSFSCVFCPVIFP